MPGPRMLCPVPKAGSKGMPSCRSSSASPLPPPSSKSRIGLRPETLWWLTLMTYTSSRIQSVPVQHTTWFVKPCGNSAALRSTKGGSCVGIAWEVLRHRASPSLRLPATRLGEEMPLRLRVGLWSLAPQIGCDDFVAQHGARRLQEEEPLLYGTCRAHRWPGFYFCAVPRANHLLRTAPPQQVAPYATAHDQRMHTELRRLLGLASAEHDAVLQGLSEEIWKQCV